MKLFRNILLGSIILLCGTVSAQELALPADPAPEQLDFVHRTLVLQYTGTECVYCVNMIKPIDALLKDDNYNNLFHLAVCHSFAGDPMLLNPDNVTPLCPEGGFPRAFIGFTEQTANAGDIRTTLIRQIATCWYRGTKAGIAANSKLEGNTLTVKAQLKAVTDGDYSIGCWLLEDGIKAGQANMGVISHNNTIRYAEKAYGNELGTVKAKETAETTFTIPLQAGWEKENCHLLLFACVYTEYTDGTGERHDAKYIITNVINAPLSTPVPYKYLSDSAIDEVETSNDIQVNASGDQLEVTAASPIESLAIYNMQGRLMLQLSPKSESVLLSTGDLPAGIYTLRASHNKGVKTKKISIKL